jgi:hypothetical protein
MFAGTLDLSMDGLAQNTVAKIARSTESKIRSFDMMYDANESHKE